MSDLSDDDRCGEPCERMATATVAGYTFCGPCLERVVVLGMEFALAIESAATITAANPPLSPVEEADHE